MTTSEQRKARALAELAQLTGRADETFRRALDDLWAAAFEAGRLAALDELQDRLCVCMK